MPRKPSNRDHLFVEGPSRKNILWTCLGIVVFFLLLVSVVKRFTRGIDLNHETASTNCTLFASPSGNDANTGVSPSSPKSFSAASAATHPGSAVCLLGGTYNLSSTFYPPQGG